MTNTALNIWDSGTNVSGTIAESYLETFGLGFTPENVRFSLSQQIEAEGKILHLPAVLFAFMMQSGIAHVERHLLDPDTAELLFLDQIGDTGRGMWLPCEPGAELGIAVGIAPAIAAAKENDFPIGAITAIAAAELLDLPEGTHTLHFFEGTEEKGAFDQAVNIFSARAISAKTRVLPGLSA